jgi:ATP-dependent protease HslVU (ClpYQ) peptidase subunit
MSVVAVKVTDKKITIGADSILAYGWTQEKNKLAKIEKVNGMIIGSVGIAQEGALLRMYCKTRKPRAANCEAMVDFISEFHDWLKNKTGDTELQNDYIIVYKKKVFSLNNGYYVKEVNDYDAIGAGMDFALSALYLGKSCKDAIKAACHLSVYCEEPINMFKVKK